MVKLLQMYSRAIPGSAIALAVVAALGRSEHPAAEGKLVEILDSAVEGSATSVVAANALGVLRRRQAR